ncbi:MULTISPECIES: DUF6035 family protein [Pseudomonas]|uniref:DUF6035 family protein n=1 Tax=Pseudomonas TaxID=286 RepID=UPI000464606C|nr:MULTISPECIES: DUF6035 family protein [Pseudomonas]KIU48813.1 hypothetical protein QV12_17370 [Pseudomonas putida]RRW61958.1 hypothetical protein EGJ51_11440 [Pseudomonas fulva]UJW20198.1 DUF6035 family protein [Pseudomonas juntendi]
MRTLEYAQPTEHMKLTDVMDLDSAAPIEIASFLSRELSLVIQDRAELASRFVLDRDKPWLVCQLCGAALLLVRTHHRFFHFRHHPTIEGLIKCDISTKGELSPAQITAIKYNAQKESAAHLRLKGIIRDSLVADRSCGDPQVEKVWKGQAVAERATWRKPDVQVVRGDDRIAFEVQLSTTFLTEIVGRREFYRANGGSMIWVFENFDPSATRTAEEDIFFLNNLNVFIVNDRTLALSRSAGRMALDCWYAVPQLVGRAIVNEWRRADVYLDELTFCFRKQVVFYNDYQAQRKALEASVNSDVLRRDFHVFWMEFGRQDTPESRERWLDLRERMATVFPAIKLPNFHWSDPFQGAVSIVLSARYGRPIGYRFERLLNVCNQAFDSYKPFLLQFGWTLEIFEHNELVIEQDKKGTWAKRRAIIRAALKDRDDAYRPDRQYNHLFAFLVPELKERLINMREW